MKKRMFGTIKAGLILTGSLVLCAGCASTRRDPVNGGGGVLDPKYADPLHQSVEPMVRVTPEAELISRMSQDDRTRWKNKFGF